MYNIRVWCVCTQENWCANFLHSRNLSAINEYTRVIETQVALHERGEFVPLFILLLLNRWHDRLGGVIFFPCLCRWFYYYLIFCCCCWNDWIFICNCKCVLLVRYFMWMTFVLRNFAAKHFCWTSMAVFRMTQFSISIRIIYGWIETEMMRCGSV